MLVLSRREGEEILIGERIRVRVARIKGNRVQVAVQAPISMSILRGEVKQKERSGAFDLRPSFIATSDIATSDIATSDIATIDIATIDQQQTPVAAEPVLR